MKERFSKLIDVKSIITLSIMFTFEFIVIYITLKTSSIDNMLFTVFSNILTAMTTYYFTKPKDKADKIEGDNAK